MLFLFLAVLCGTIKGYFGKRISSYGDTASTCVHMQLFRLVICAAVGGGMLLFRMPAVVIAGPEEFLVDLLSGVSTAVFLISWTLVDARGALGCVHARDRVQYRRLSHPHALRLLLFR